MRAVCYPRVSSTKQRETHTIESQLRMLPEFIARMGWQLVEPTDTYMDDGKTAKAGHLEKRHGLARLLQDAAAGQFDVVVVVDQDRLSRAEDIIERATIMGAFQRAGVKVASAISGQVLDLDTSHGDLMASLGGFFAAEWSRKHRARIMEGKATAVARGRKPAGPTPYGLTYDRATGSWGIDEPRAAVVRDIYARVIRGEALRHIGLYLEASGALRTQFDGVWNHARVREIATKTTYRGEWLANKAKRIVVQVPAIIDPATWEAAQVALRARRNPNWHRGVHVNLCQGLSRCGVCGAFMGLTGGGGKFRYYSCMHKKRDAGRGIDRCSNRMRRVPETDELVWSRIRDLVVDPDLLAEAVGMRESDNTDALQRDLADYERRLRKLERAEADILAMYRRGKVSAGAFERELASAARDREHLERNRDFARDQLGRAALANAQVDAMAAAVSDLRSRVDTATAEERRELMKVLIPPGVGAITMRPGEVEIVGLLPVPKPAPAAALPADAAA